jgi:hypothetical protein
MGWLKTKKIRNVTKTKARILLETVETIPEGDVRAWLLQLLGEVKEMVFKEVSVDTNMSETEKFKIVFEAFGEEFKNWIDEKGIDHQKIYEKLKSEFPF